MAKKQEKMVAEITSMDEDFAKWYTDIVKKAELIDYSSVRGCYILRPYGYAIWENIQRILDARLKELGHENVCMPMFIPESLLQKERTMWKASRRNAPGSPSAVPRSFPSASVSGPPPKPCSVSITPM